MIRTRLKQVVLMDGAHWPLVEGGEDFSNLIGGERKFVLDADGQRTTSSKMFYGNTFL
jgi:hypothetical protein